MSALPGTGRSTVGCQRTDLCITTSGGGRVVGPGKKTAEAIQKEVTREVEQLLRIAFGARRKTGRLDLEALEMAVRSAMHQAGAAALTKLLQFPAPATDQR